MTTYRIYGHSDDLIEIQGNVSEEITANYDEPTFISLGETVLRVVYSTDGVWRITIETMGPKDDVTRFGREHTYVQSSYNDYTELVVVNTDVERVRLRG